MSIHIPSDEETEAQVVHEARADPGLDQVKVEEIVSENVVVPMPGAIEGTFELLCYTSLPCCNVL